MKLIFTGDRTSIILIYKSYQISVVQSYSFSSEKKIIICFHTFITFVTLLQNVLGIILARNTLVSLLNKQIISMNYTRAPLNYVVKVILFRNF